MHFKHANNYKDDDETTDFIEATSGKNSIMHKICDGKKNTLIILKTT